MFTLGLTALSSSFAILLLFLLLNVLALAKQRTQSFPFRKTIAWLAFGLHTLSVFALLAAQLSENYNLSYVSAVISTGMPTTLKLTALWGGQAGSLFFWSWVLHACLFIYQLIPAGKKHTWAAPIIAANVLFFIALSLFAENPFARVWLLSDGRLAEAVFAPAVDARALTLSGGQGLNPLLRHPGMIIHPPVLYFGYAAFLVPFALALSSLLKNETEYDVTNQSYGWLMAGWVLLTAGIALGSWWSYDVLGWGGYWAWDPVEVASLLPWLTATALLHSRIVLQRRRIFLRLNVVLVILTFFLIAFSIYLTRSGVLSSVHAFGESRVQVPIIVFYTLLFLGTSIALVKRWKSLTSGWQISSYLSREALMLYTNIMLLALMLVCLWGLVYPIITGAFGSTQITLDAAYYERTTAPLFMLLVLLMGVCPLVGWVAATAKKLGKRILLPLIVSLGLTAAVYLLGVHKLSALLTIWLVLIGAAVLLSLTIRDLTAIKLKRPISFLWRQRRRYGAYLVHTGILLIALSITGVESLSASIQGTLLSGERMPLENYELEFKRIHEDAESPDYQSFYAEVRLYKDNRLLADLQPGQHIYAARNQYVSIPAVKSSLGGDLYVLLLGYDTEIPYATLRLTNNPLIIYMWIGAAAMILGAILAASDTRPSVQAEAND